MKKQFTPDSITQLLSNEIFVFGSNLNGNHAGGAARFAVEQFGAINGQAEGLQGQSYAIPTLDEKMKKCSIEAVESSIDTFRNYAERNSELTFFVTKIGCGIAGFELSQMASIFKQKNFPSNVFLPIEFCVTKGFKAFNKDLKCRGFQFEIGNIYQQNDAPRACNTGFHFCEKLIDCFDYYSFDRKETRIAEVECLGLTHTDDGQKYATNIIQIGKEIDRETVMSIVNVGSGNTGKGNSGDRNSGDRNSGDRNSGDRNSGDRNSGDRNSGDRNSGYRNSGDRNSGDLNSGYRNSGDLNSGYRNSGYRNSGYLNSGYRNSGDLNSGYRNSGDLNSGYRNSGDLNSGYRNSGDLNSGYRNSGVFCNRKREDFVPMFNKDSNMTWEQWDNHPAKAAASNLTITSWVSWDNMTDDEKKEHPKAFVPEGYVKTFEYKEAWANLWKELSAKQKNSFKTLPNFDSVIFEDITGIKF